MFEDVLIQLNNYYRDLRERAEDKARFFSQKADEDEKYRELFKKSRALELETYRAEFDCDEIRARELEQQLAQIKIQLNNRLNEIGIAPEELKPRYLCEKCSDTGYINGKPCECLRKNLLKLKTLALTGGRTFPSFADENSGDEKLEKTYGFMKNYCEKFPQVRYSNFLFTGKTGTGKTMLAECVAEKLTERGFNVMFFTALELNNLFLRYHTGNGADRYSIMDALSECDLLIVDDLGTEPLLKNVTVEYLVALTNNRQLKTKHTIFTTNLKAGEILSRYEERFFSRINDKSKCLTFSFDGADLRSKK